MLENTVSRAVAVAGCALLTLGTVMLLGVRPAMASGPTVTGAGSTWVQIALDQWRADIARQGLSINFQGVGSSAGREFYIINQVDFAATEIPFQPDEVAQLQAEHKSYQYLPDVAGGTSLMYNLHSPSGSRITTLRLDAGTAAKIFTGVITSWQDPAVQSLNPGLQIRETTVTPVIRSDGSGTSAQFSLYLADQASATWNAFVSTGGCPAPCSLWPPFPGSTQQKGSDGVSNFVANDAIGGGSIGYVEAGYAFGRGFPVASLRNESGNFTQPTSGNVATALTHATLYGDRTQNLTGVYRAPEAAAYAMSSYSYMVTQTAGFDPARGNVLGTWLIYIACAGQQEASALGYSPLPPNLVSTVFDAVQQIPGAPAPPPVDRAHCDNPTIGSSGGGAGTSSGAGGGGNGAGGGGGVGGNTTRGTTDTGGPGMAATGVANGNLPAAPDGSTTAAVAGGGLGGSPLSSGVHVVTLGDAARRASFARAEQTVLAAQPPFVRPLILSGAVIMAMVFGPMLAGRRSRIPRRGDSRAR